MLGPRCSCSLRGRRPHRGCQRVLSAVTADPTPQPRPGTATCRPGSEGSCRTPGGGLGLPGLGRGLLCARRVSCQPACLPGGRGAQLAPAWCQHQAPRCPDRAPCLRPTVSPRLARCPLAAPQVPSLCGPLTLGTGPPEPNPSAPMVARPPSRTHADLLWATLRHPRDPALRKGKAVSPQASCAPGSPGRPLSTREGVRRAQCGGGARTARPDAGQRSRQCPRGPTPPRSRGRRGHKLGDSLRGPDTEDLRAAITSQPVGRTRGSEVLSSAP